MPIEDHPLLKSLAERTTIGETRDDIHRQAHVEFALSAPNVRLDTLKKLNEQIVADDGTSLRQKAQIHGLHRELSAMHQQMRKVGR